MTGDGMDFLKRSVLILVALYGLVFAVGDAYLSHMGSPLWVVLAFPIVLIGIQYVIGPLFMSG
jgi:hypothetical protein